MTREAMIAFMEVNPNVKITHTLFDSEEYIYQKEDGNVYDENGNLFDNWDSDDRHNGVRMRIGGSWEDGWSVKFDKNTCKLLSTTTSGKEYLYNSICKNCQYFRGACSYM